MSSVLPVVRNLLGHAHPAIVHFPVALLLTGAGLETLDMARGRSERSRTARILLVLGSLAAVLAAVSGLSLFRAGDYSTKTLDVARIHRVLGMSVALASLATVATGELPWGSDPRGRRLALYRASFLVVALLVALAGHYGGWIVFGWGRIWTL